MIFTFLPKPTCTCPVVFAMHTVPPWLIFAPRIMLIIIPTSTWRWTLCLFCGSGEVAGANYLLQAVLKASMSIGCSYPWSPCSVTICHPIVAHLRGIAHVGCGVPSAVIAAAVFFFAIFDFERLLLFLDLVQLSSSLTSLLMFSSMTCFFLLIFWAWGRVPTGVFCTSWQLWRLL